MTDQAPESIEIQDLQGLVAHQKEVQLAETHARLMQAHLEIQKLLIQKKYKLGDSDQIDISTGKITRVAQ